MRLIGPLNAVCVAILCAVFTLACAPPAPAQVVLSFYLGGSQTAPSDLHVVQPARGNDAVMHRVSWAGYPFRFEVYYGLRLSFSPAGHPQTRFVLDYTHYKIYARNEAVIAQDGTWHGEPFHDLAPMRARVQSFEVTHGLNMLGVSVLQQLSGHDGVYAGGGPVIYLPHPETRVDGLPLGNRFDFGGFGFQLHAGVRGCVGAKRLFAEIKYNQGRPAMTIAQGRAWTRLRTVHELGGFDFGRCR